MPGILHIQSSGSGWLKVTLAPSKPGSFVATLSLDGLQASVDVDTYMSSSLPAFFADLAENWRGWQGTRFWGSLEDELRIEATHDRVGHINVRIRMQAYVGTPQEWSITGNLVLEPGALEALAREAERFFQSEGWGWK